MGTYLNRYSILVLGFARIFFNYTNICNYCFKKVGVFYQTEFLANLIIFSKFFVNFFRKIKRLGPYVGLLEAITLQKIKSYFVCVPTQK